MSLLLPQATDEFQSPGHRKSNARLPRPRTASLTCRYQVSEQASPEHLQAVFDLIFQQAVEHGRSPLPVITN